MRAWSKVDVAATSFLMCGIIGIIFSVPSVFTIFALLVASICFMHGVYKTNYDAYQYKSMLCHYQAILSSSNEGWISWNSANAYIGASKIIKKIFNLPNREIFFSDIIAAINKNDAELLSANFEELKKIGTKFSCIITTIENKKIHITGSKMTINELETITLWCSNVTGYAEKIDLLKTELQSLTGEKEKIEEVMDNLPIPIWMRDNDLRIIYCNRTYCDNLGYEKDKIVKKNIPLVPGTLFGQGHSLAETAKKSHHMQNISQYTVLNGTRKKLSVYEGPIRSDNFIGFALDLTTEDDLSSNLDKVVTAYSEVLELLSTSIAIFEENTRLTFFNSAYQKLFKLEESWLHSKPTYGEVLDECRNNRQLPEHADFQAFKKNQINMFTSVTEPLQEFMHLPNGKTLRCVTAPYPLGGLLFMYEDVTDSLTLKRENNTLLAVQKETIDHLYEGVAVYGSNNRSKLMNNSFKKIWNLEDIPEENSKGIHLNEILDRIKNFLDYGEDWEKFKENTISNLTDRVPKTGELTKNDGSVILFSYIPLPDGAHMHSYIDITDTCMLEKAVLEKNQALKTAQKLRFEFVSGVSTELKEPINILIGFSELLIHQYFGILNEKQLEYCQCILDASHQLYQLINNLLEMVSVDLDSANLDISNFYLEEMVNEVVLTVQKRAEEKNVEIIRNYSAYLTSFNGDKKRLKQAIFNILINAIQFTPPNGHVDIRVVNDEKNVKIIIKDEGIGVNLDKDKKVFRRLNRANFMRSDAKTISMPLVRALIELHNGTLSISSDIGEGTSVICTLPLALQHADTLTKEEFDNYKDVINL